jgi:hypothetical protein
MIMKVYKSTFVAALLLLGLTYLSTAQSPQQTTELGTIRLDIVSSGCAALSPQMNPQPNLGSLRLNNGRLEPFELVALKEGCSLRAIAIAPNGMRLTDIPLLLLRREQLSEDTEVFGDSRNTDDYGSATWRFSLTPHTDFVYYVESPSPTKLTVRSNVVEIALCTGEESRAMVAQGLNDEFGRGCS